MTRRAASDRSTNASWAPLLRAIPLAAAGLAVGFAATATAVLAWLVGGWLVSLARLRDDREDDDLRLEGIGASHFVEKVRWSLDRLGVDYVETLWAGALGIFLLGRSVPRLHVGRGASRSSIGGSSRILRHLWGSHGEALGAGAEFLRPTPERVALEQRLDAYGVDLQRWIYGHILTERSLTLTAWGAHDARVPLWQRTLLRILHPALTRMIRAGLRVHDEPVARSVAGIEQLLAELDDRLATRGPFLGGDAPDYTDLTFAALSAIWVMPDRFARGAAGATLPAIDDWPARLLADRERWIERHPRASGLVRRLYDEMR